MVAGIPFSARNNNDAFDGMQGSFFSSDGAAEVILQKSFAEELLGITPKPGTDNTNLADLAKPLLGKELTMRYAERASAPSSPSLGRAIVRVFRSVTTASSENCRTDGS